MQYCTFALMLLRTILIIVLAQFFITTALSQESKTIDSLEVALQQENNDQNKIDLLINLTDLLMSSDPDMALKYAKETLELADSFDNNETILRVYLQLGEIYWTKTDFRSSIEYGNKAKTLAKEINSELGYAESLILITRNFADLGDYEKSSKMNFEALKIYEKLNDKKGISIAFNRIGYDYFQQGNLDKALKYYSQSLEIAREIHDLKGIARGLNNIAAVYGSKGMNQISKQKMIEAAEVNKKIGNKLWEGVIYLNLGIMYKSEMNYDTSFLYLDKASEILISLNNLAPLSTVYISLSKNYSALNKLDQSFHYANLAYELGKQNDFKKSIYDGAKQLHKLYLKQNTVDSAYKYSLVEYKMKDSLDLEDKYTELSKLELAYDIDKNEKEQKIKQQRKEMLYLLVSGIGILIFLVLYINQRSKARRKSLEQKNTLLEKEKISKELEFRNKELATNVMYSIEKNKVLKNISEELFLIEKEAVKEETQNAIQRISKKINNSVEAGSWEEFEIRFQQVHNEFYEKLAKDFPDLSINEKRLCAFLRLDMSSKEVSKVTGQSVTALESARIRLRKKLNLTNTKTNLSSFLSQY